MAACISAQTGTLAFAIFNIILVTVSTASCIGALLLWAVDSFSLDTSPLRDAMQTLDVVLQLCAILSWLSLNLVAMLFSSFLLNGIIKKNPNHIKAYFVYGIIVMLLSAFAVIVSAFLVDFAVIPLAIGGCVFGIYSLILHMIRHTYTQMEVANSQYGHHKLDETMKC